MSSYTPSYGSAPLSSMHGYGGYPGLPFYPTHSPVEAPDLTEQAAKSINLAMSYVSSFPTTPAGELRLLSANFGISLSDCIDRKEMVAALIACLGANLPDCKVKEEMVAKLNQVLNSFRPLSGTDYKYQRPVLLSCQYLNVEMLWPSEILISGAAYNPPVRCPYCGIYRKPLSSGFQAATCVRILPELFC